MFRRARFVPFVPVGKSVWLQRRENTSLSLINCPFDSHTLPPYLAEITIVAKNEAAEGGISAKSDRFCALILAAGDNRILELRREKQVELVTLLSFQLKEFFSFFFFLLRIDDDGSFVI